MPACCLSVQQRQQQQQQQPLLGQRSTWHRAIQLTLGVNGLDAIIKLLNNNNALTSG